MFVELVNTQKVWAKIVFSGSNDVEINYSGPLSIMNEESIVENMGDVLDNPVEAAALCGQPFYYKDEGKVTVRQILKKMCSPIQNRSFFEDKLFVVGGNYGADQHWGMMHPSKDEKYPYVFIGLPWKPDMCIYRISEKGMLEKVGEPTFGDAGGPQTHQLTSQECDAIRKVLLEEKGCAIYSH